MMSVVKMHKLPISIVEENFEMSRIHAIRVRMTKRTRPGVQGPTFNPNNACSKLTHVSVINEQNEMVNENCVAAIIISKTILARFPNTFMVMSEYDLSPTL